MSMATFTVESRREIEIAMDVYVGSGGHVDGVIFHG